jgi:hypothetical protein
MQIAALCGAVDALRPLTAATVGNRAVIVKENIHIKRGDAIGSAPEPFS